MDVGLPSWQSDGRLYSGDAEKRSRGMKSSWALPAAREVVRRLMSCEVSGGDGARLGYGSNMERPRMQMSCCFVAGRRHLPRFDSLESWSVRRPTQPFDIRVHTNIQLQQSTITSQSHISSRVKLPKIIRHYAMAKKPPALPVTTIHGNLVRVFISTWHIRCNKHRSSLKPGRVWQGSTSL